MVLAASSNAKINRRINKPVPAHVLAVVCPQTAVTLHDGLVRRKRATTADVVHDDPGWVVNDFPACNFSSITEIYILAIEKELFIQQADIFKQLPADHHASPGDPIHFAH